MSTKINMMEVLKKSSTSKLSSTLDTSELNTKLRWRTQLPALNIALNGDINGGLGNGLTIFAGPSKHFKSNMALCCVAAYLKANPEAVCIFYDSEFGITDTYLKSFKIDPARVLHTPIEDIEQLKHDMSVQLDNIKRGDKVIFLIDSLGNIASNKEVEDALKGESKADMTRAKSMKSFTRIVSNKLVLRDLPCVAVNHTYDTQEMFSKTVMSGGTGLTYNAHTIIIIGRRQIKEGKEIVGWDFVLNVEKSRYVKEKSKISISVTYEGGICPWSGLLELSVENGFVVKPSNGWYSRSFINEETGEVVVETEKYRAKDTNNIKFWAALMKHKPFVEAIDATYKLKAITTESIDFEDDDE
ncbi:recombinase [Paraglaciecola Antarctic GD virus 1]|nr:recombinase [Paraglaciecola Antarctic GD virus 1]